MRINSELDRWVEGVDASSIVNWDYQDNFNPVYFFCTKDFTRTKSIKPQTNDFHLLKVMHAKKNIHFVAFCSLIFTFVGWFAF